MKWRIYFRPTVPVLALMLCAAAGALAARELCSWAGLVCSAGAVFYGALALLAGYALWRCHRCERWMRWDHTERLLILVPHQDDCVICAGGAGLRNQHLGGETHIVYVVQDEDPALAARRIAEANAAWALAGVPADRLRHLNLLPPLHAHDPHRLEAAARELHGIIQSIAPTVVILPLFEGGHIHHDLLNHLVISSLGPEGGLRVFEAPEYSPYVSLRRTPHRIISLCARWIFGLVAYYGPPDGIDDRPIDRVRLTPAELDLKRRMLFAFTSQHGDALAANRIYPDRLIRWEPRPYRSTPFAVTGSLLRFVQSPPVWLPAGLVRRIFPLLPGTVGRQPGVTCLDDELRLPPDPP